MTLLEQIKNKIDSLPTSQSNELKTEHLQEIYALIAKELDINNINSIADRKKIFNLMYNQITGVQVFENTNDIVTPEINVSYKIYGQEPGFYHWDGSNFVKDDDFLDDNNHQKFTTL
ncbi:MAG: hypothetical protein ACPG6V_05185, partial [Flavobacteriales bacterium]